MFSPLSASARNSFAADTVRSACRSKYSKKPISRPKMRSRTPMARRGERIAHLPAAMHYDGSMPCTFGPFEVLARIATDRISQTFIALHVGADAFRRIVALKTLQPELCKDDNAKNAFANGAKLAAKLNHPSCVGVE